MFSDLFLVNFLRLFFSPLPACNVECDVGLMHCYRDGASQKCCNFYDVDDNCVAECDTNQAPNGDYTCLCSGFFEPQQDCTGERKGSTYLYVRVWVGLKMETVAKILILATISTLQDTYVKPKITLDVD